MSAWTFVLFDGSGHLLGWSTSLPARSWYAAREQVRMAVGAGVEVMPYAARRPS